MVINKKCMKQVRIWSGYVNMVLNANELFRKEFKHV